MERVYRVAYIDTDKPQQDIRHLFSQCGEIRGIHPWSSGDNQSNTHFFVEFSDESSVKRARALQVPDIKVHVLAFSPQLIAHFSSVAPPTSPSHKFKREPSNSPHVRAQTPGFTHKKQFRPNGSYGTPGRKFIERKSSHKPYDKHHAKHHNKKWVHRAATERSDSSWQTSANHTRRVADPNDNCEIEKENDHVDCATPAITIDTSMITEGDETTNREGLASSSVLSLSDALSTFRLPLPSESSQSESVYAPSPLRPMSFGPSPTTCLPTPAPSSPISASPSIVLSYAGDRFACDLEAMTEDPEAVISVLTRTAASTLERDKWMIVAGHYRGKGNIDAAIAVISAMVDVMTSFDIGMSERALNPAFLMLSSCHADLAKQLRVSDNIEDRESAEEHHQKSQVYLRKVYGLDVPVIKSEPIPISVPFRGYLTNTSNLQTLPSVETMPKTTTESYTYLQREVQSLRDRHTNNQAYLAQARTSKRKLEDELNIERHTRRKAERELEHVMQDLSSARRSEKFALEQCRREVENRRRVEERAVELRDEMVEMKKVMDVLGREASEKERRARECFGKLGVLFLKAAKGEVNMEGEVLSGLGFGGYGDAGRRGTSSLGSERGRD